MSCALFVAEAFALRTATHQLHLASRSYAEHVALGEYYDGLLDLIDQYAEVYQGLTGKLLSLPNVPVPKGSAIELLTEFLKTLREEFDEDERYQSLINILAEMEELTARTLYKLRFLK